MNAAPADRQRKCRLLLWRIPLFILLAAAGVLATSRAQAQPTADPHAGHRMMPSAAAVSVPAGDSSAKAAMDMGSMQGGAAPPDARDPHAYSDGYDFGPYALRLADTHSLGSLLVDNLETVRSDGSGFVGYDLQTWYGRVYDRAVFKSEGDIDSGELTEARNELLWGHAVATFWDTQLGVRFDNGEGPNRTWLAFGVQGLAPYWFEVEATGYLGEEGRTALRLDVSYELLLTQKLILQPRIEADAFGKDDTALGLGKGLSDLVAALRLRYEIRREFAPYVGVEWARKFGTTRDLARAAGEDANEARFVAGLRFWF